MRRGPGGRYKMLAADDFNKNHELCLQKFTGVTVEVHDICLWITRRLPDMVALNRSAARKTLHTDTAITWIALNR